MAFVDVRMPPGWDGIETISRIWEVYPELQVVICTAFERDVQACLHDLRKLDVVKRIGSIQADPQTGAPVATVVIKSIRVNTK